MRVFAVRVKASREEQGMEAIVRALLTFLLALVVANLTYMQAAEAQRAGPQPARKPRPAVGQLGKIEYYTSKVDGEKRPYVICATDETDEPKPMLVIVSPGGTGLQGAQWLTGDHVDKAKKAGISLVVLRPTGRGPGTLYMHYGEVDMFEAIDDACTKYAVDRDRISVFGHSMGGAATWYLTSHYPDYFSAGGPTSGYCDYRLWDKAGGYTYHMNEWEEPSWISRSAVFLAENYLHTPIWAIHGDLDRALGGGVPVEHSRRMTGLLKGLGYDCKYTEVKGAGHHFLPEAPNSINELVVWMAKQKKERSPEQVRLAAYTLRHNKSYWVTIEQFDYYGDKRGYVDAKFGGEGKLVVKTENVRTLSLGPIEGRDSVSVEIDGQEMADVDLSERKMFRHDDEGKWEMGTYDLSKEKRHGRSGPTGDLFFDRTVLVVGTTGTEIDTRFNGAIAGYAARWYKDRNGGVHRGGIMGQNDVELEMVKDSGLSEERLKGSNLILYGNYGSNSVLKRFEGKLPVEFGEKTIRIHDKTFSGEDVTVFAIFPHPENAERYVAVHGGVSDDAIVWGSHLDMALLPDYLVYDHGKMLEWGFWGNDWRFQE